MDEQTTTKVPETPPEAIAAAAVFDRVGAAVVGANPLDAIGACIACAAVLAVQSKVKRDEARAMFDATWDQHAKVSERK